LLKVTVELDMKFVPVMVNVCAAAPAVTEDGERLVMLGRGLDVGGAGEPPPPPPPQEEMRREQTAAVVITAKMARS
jgi:hypothetical protein